MAKTINYPSDEDVRAAALHAANAVRAKLGLGAVEHLYPGKPCDPLSCAITETIYDDDLDRSKYFVRTNGNYVYVKRGRSRVVKHTLGVRASRFIHRFDKREYPDLIREIK